MEELWKLEKENADSLDRAADPFGMMIADLSDYVLKEFATEYTRRLCYSIGKWVYLIDALDDYEKDIKKKNYNPFFAAFGEGSKCEMLAAHGEEVNFVFPKRICGKRGVFAEYQIPFQPRSDGQYHSARHSRDDQTHSGGQMRLQNKKRIEEVRA